jgi:hypothetical protein
MYLSFDMYVLMVWHSHTYRNHIVPHDAKNIALQICIQLVSKSKNVLKTRQLLQESLSVVFVYVFADSLTRFYFYRSG